MSAERLVINGETCELVTDFASLGTAMIVYDLACAVCRREHCREMLTSLTEIVSNGQDGVAWEYVPDCGPPHPEKVRGISAHMVAARRIWRVVDEEITKVTQARERVVSR